jgi:hypothetical protein
MRVWWNACLLLALGQERAYETPGISNADVAAAVESNDPKGALAALILAAPQEEMAPRTVSAEWPGYRGGERASEWRCTATRVSALREKPPRRSPLHPSVSVFAGHPLDILTDTIMIYLGWGAVRMSM